MPKNIKNHSPHCNMLLRLIYLITARTAEGNVFSSVSLSTGGVHMWPDHYPWYIWPLMGPLANDIWWTSLEICSNCEECSLQSTSTDIQWPPKYASLASGWYASYWKASVLKFVFLLTLPVFFRLDLALLFLWGQS